MSKPSRVKQTQYGLSALIFALVSLLALALYFGISALQMSPATFSFWNGAITLAYCVTVPGAFLFFILARRSKNEARSLANFALALILIPFFVLLFQFISSFSR
ncbi:MAG: hypothetical protein IT311_09940 [Anaerolineales bacterium]|nr:hypothetical protein [Anaerolineales bacterium]MCZ2123508.1 hypothetical protein [Anaerolineales bacterium]